MSAHDRLAIAIHGLPPAPCDDGCPAASQCLRHQLACGDYYRWVRGDEIPLGDRLPLRALYNHIFRDAPKNEEPGLVRLRGRLRRVGNLLRSARINTLTLADMAAGGMNLTRYIRAKAGG